MGQISPWPGFPKQASTWSHHPHPCSDIHARTRVVQPSTLFLQQRLVASKQDWPPPQAPHEHMASRLRYTTNTHDHKEFVFWALLPLQAHSHWNAPRIMIPVQPTLVTSLLNESRSATNGRGSESRQKLKNDIAQGTSFRAHTPELAHRSIRS